MVPGRTRRVGKQTVDRVEIESVCVSWPVKLPSSRLTRAPIFLHHRGLTSPIPTPLHSHGSDSYPPPQSFPTLALFPQAAATLASTTAKTTRTLQFISTHSEEVWGRGLFDETRPWPTWVSATLFSCTPTPTFSIQQVFLSLCEQLVNG